MATTEDIEFVRGEDVTIRVTVTGENIIGWSLAFAVSRKSGAGNEIIKSTGSGITITDGGNGVFEISIDDTDTTELPTGVYLWDVKRNDAGQEAVLTRGYLTLKPNVAP